MKIRLISLHFRRCLLAAMLLFTFLSGCSDPAGESTPGPENGAQPGATPTLAPSPAPSPTPTPRAGVFLPQDQRAQLLNTIEELEALAADIEREKSILAAQNAFEHLFTGVNLITFYQELALQNQEALDEKNLEESVDRVNALLQEGKQEIDQASVYMRELNQIPETEYDRRNAAEEKFVMQIQSAVNTVVQALTIFKEMDEV
jgi:hypothetical protein